jgi:tyrosyl-tRNA synthetase
MIFQELVDRGLVKQTTNAEKIRQLLDNQKIAFYIGFDPTADSLHVGHLLQLVTARRLVDAGHTAVMLIGGSTALIGDPTGKTEMRKMLSRSDINVNSEAIEKQIKQIVGPSVHMVNNLLWHDGANFLQVLRELGPFFSVNNMLRAECFKSRMENGLSFLEFNYMILQAEDFRILNLEFGENCVLQIGGDDQWSNILAGIELIHKKEKREAFGLTLPLLVNSDGTKMGKTEKGAVWLDPNKTTPFDFFQFWRNLPDDQARKCFDLFADCSPNGLNINELKKVLAFHLTTLVHSQDAADRALEQAEALFEKRDTSTLETTPIADGTHILDLVIKCGFAKSRTEARNLITNKGITINEEVQTNPTINISKSIFGNELIVKKGKKHFCRLLIEDTCQDHHS